MQPLFHAIGHGVKAGKVQEAFDEIFWRRIRRRDEFYITRVLGAFGADLASIAQLFESPWSTPNSALRAMHQAWLLGEASYALKALGRLSESVAPREAALAMFKAHEDWAGAARNGGELTTTLLTLGDVGRAVAVSEQALEHADRAGDQQEREFRTSDLANALAAAGDLSRAAELFTNAETTMR